MQNQNKSDASVKGGGHLRQTASAIFHAALSAVDPAACVRRWLHPADGGVRVAGRELSARACRNIYIAAIGKAAASMAGAAEAVLEDRIKEGLVITKYGHGQPLARCRVMEAGHPVPDESGMKATDALIELLQKAGPNDLVLCLVSGGGSALSPAPAPGISLADKQAATGLLLGCGADIHEINTIRKHLSRVKGGQLCRFVRGAAVVSLILSDVVGDDIHSIASGITAPDPGTFSECMEIITRYGLWEKIPRPVQKHLSEGIDGLVPETPKPGDPVFASVTNHIVGSNSRALAAAGAEAERLGFRPLVLSSMIQGEARETAKVLCAVLKEVRRSGHPASPPACVLSGGETTVTVRGSGKGGRNMEMALSAAIELAGLPDILFLSTGTDGTDGPTDAAGAFADGGVASRAQGLGLSMRQSLAGNDAYRFFRQTGDLFITGPTGTNVMDLQIMLVSGGSSR